MENEEKQLILMNKQFTPQIKSYPSQDCSIILWTTGLLKIKQRTFNIKCGLVKSTRTREFCIFSLCCYRTTTRPCFFRQWTNGRQVLSECLVLGDLMHTLKYKKRQWTYRKNRVGTNSIKFTPWLILSYRLYSLIFTRWMCL